MEEVTVMMWPKKNPDTVRITKINCMRRRILDRIDDCAHDIDDLLEYWLQAEASYVKDTILKDLWKHEAWLNKLLCDANPDIKQAQWWDKQEESTDTSTVTCPECWWSGAKMDKCPDCDYDFNSKEDDKDA